MFRRSKTSIRLKLLVTMLIITLVPLFAVAYLQFANAKQVVYDLTIHDLQYLTKLKAAALEPYTQDTQLDSVEQAKIKEIVDDVARNYYEVNGMKGYAFILDSKGVTLFHPQPGQDLGHYDFIQEMISRKNGTIEYYFNGGDKITAFVTLPNGWVLGIGSYTDDLLQPITKTRLWMIAITIAAGIAALLTGALIVHRILVPLKRLVAAMRSAESGDLTMQVPVTTRDELGQLSGMYNDMMSIFRDMLKEVQLSAQQVASAAEELTASAEENARASEQISVFTASIATGSERQKEVVEHTTASLHQIGQDIERIAANAKQVSLDSQHASGSAQQGRSTLQQLVAEMAEITSRVNATQKVVRQLGERSEAIRGIISIIQEISSQTNLLALNAAIEAARAGEHGRSFAVVANEVRKLAEASGSAAEQIAQMIHTIHDEIAQAVEAMNATSKAVDQGQSGVSTAATAFEHILHAVDDVSRQIVQMNEAAREIAEGTREIIRNADAVAELAEQAARDTQEVAAASEQQTATTQEMTAASETLARMAEQLSEQVRRFTI